MSPDGINGPSVAILDYGMGNLRSVHRAFLEVGAEARLVEKPAEVKDGEALVFPGQGAIVDTMRLLAEYQWDRFIREWIAADRPFFGICLGLQALFEFSEEGQTKGLGVFPGRVRRFQFPESAGLKVPHMGWNTVTFTDDDTGLLQNIRSGSDQFYFVHSYFVESDDPSISWGTTTYGETVFTSAIRRGRALATQFHPEKSQSVGLQLYRNFLSTLTPG